MLALAENSLTEEQAPPLTSGSTVVLRLSAFWFGPFTWGLVGDVGSWGELGCSQGMLRIFYVIFFSERKVL